MPNKIIRYIMNICKRDPRMGKVTTGGIVTVKDSTVTAPLEGTTVSGWISAWVNEMEFSNSTVDITAPNGRSGARTRPKNLLCTKRKRRAGAA